MYVGISIDSPKRELLIRSVYKYVLAIVAGLTMLFIVHCSASPACRHRTRFHPLSYLIQLSSSGAQYNQALEN